MAKTKVVKITGKDANTIEIDPNLADVNKFNSKLITDAGFKIEYIKLRGARQKTKESEYLTLPNGVRFRISHETSDVYYMPYLRHKFNSTIKGLLKADPKAAFSIREIVLVKGDNRYVFEIRGGNGGRCILYKRNDTIAAECKVDLMKELAGLFFTTCYFVKGENKRSVICNSNE